MPRTRTACAAAAVVCPLAGDYCRVSDACEPPAPRGWQTASRSQRTGSDAADHAWPCAHPNCETGQSGPHIVHNETVSRLKNIKQNVKLPNFTLFL